MKNLDLLKMLKNMGPEKQGIYMGLKNLSQLISCFKVPVLTRGGSRVVAISEMELFVIIVNGFQPLTIITKSSILDGEAVLDPPLLTVI